MRFVGAERQVESVLALELLLRRHGIGRDAKQRGAGRLEFAPQRGERLRLERAAGGVGAGVEEQHEHAPGEVAERRFAAAVGGQAEVRDAVGDREGGLHTPSFRRFPKA